MSCKRSQPLESPPVNGGNIVQKQLPCCGVFGLLRGKVDAQLCGDELHKPLAPGPPISGDLVGLCELHFLQLLLEKILSLRRLYLQLGFKHDPSRRSLLSITLPMDILINVGKGGS